MIQINKKQRVRDAGVSQRKWLAIEFLGKTNLNLNTLNPVFSYLPVDAENNKQERGENVTSSSNHHQNLAHHVAGIPLHEWESPDETFIHTFYTFGRNMKYVS